MDYDAIVIGAGMGGLSAGACLAAGGARTLILEQSGAVGGCAGSFENSGFHFDVGACIIQVPRAHDRLFETLGLRREDYVTFLQNDPTYEFVDILGGRRFTTPSSLEGTAEVIARFDPDDARNFLLLMRRYGPRFDAFNDVMMTTPQGRLRDMAKVFRKCPSGLLALPDVLKPYSKVLDDYFRHPVTRGLLSTYSAIGGLPPSLQTAMMLWLCHTEHDGTYYPAGGMGALPRGVAKAFGDLGGDLRLETPVRRVLVEKGRARGVELADGTAITSRVLVANNNARNLYLEMVGRDRIPRAVVKGLESYEWSPSCCVAYLGLDYRPELRAQHMVGLIDPGLTDLYLKDVYTKGLALPQSVGLVSSPSYMDPSLAPEGQASLALIAMAPPHPAGGTWSEIKWDFLDGMITTADAMFLPGLKDHVVFKTIATPEDFERRLSMPNGSIYAFSFSILSQMVFRPANRSRCVDGLYLCGASTHPGGSVPGSVFSGMMVSEMALEELDSRAGSRSARASSETGVMDGLTDRRCA
ncbi:MAG: NAD(P)/FAD-dependent oxidoreductase [Actinobacteria bacterium]|nr:NAD(P)/FAD-dependent oxidoreductase [Actinomycetota bacterium]MBU1943465.1 NAD(P)/FAD-dependent oxidoreductase [Actinomycetota bacterium]MBU2686822.1 NAD(P)/FAD-dependent oxidoreductase [Actinomycetota bacterium]